MNLSFSKRKTQKVGKGTFVTARRILPNAQDAKKRVTLAGRVIKTISGKTTLEQGLRLKRMINEYTEKLREAKIQTIGTNVRVIPTRKPGAIKVLMIQSFVPQENILSNRIKKCPPQEAVYWFVKTKELIENLSRYNKTHKTKLGLDAMPKNFGIINNKLVLIDLYPAYVKGNEQIKLNDISKRKRGIVRLIKRKLFEERVQRKSEITLERKMNDEKLMDELLYQFSRKRPELLDKFIEAI